MGLILWSAYESVFGLFAENKQLLLKFSLQRWVIWSTALTKRSQGTFKNYYILIPIMLFYIANWICFSTCWCILDPQCHMSKTGFIYAKFIYVYWLSLVCSDLNPHITETHISDRRIWDWAESSKHGSAMPIFWLNIWLILLSIIKLKWVTA